MITLDFYIQQIIVIFLVLNLKNYCYFKFRDTILLYIDAIMDLIYTIVVYIIYGFGMTILTLYNGIGIETIFYTVIFVFGIVKIFQIIFIFKNKKINKKMIKSEQRYIIYITFALFLGYIVSLLTDAYQFACWFTRTNIY